MAETSKIPWWEKTILAVVGFGMFLVTEIVLRGMVQPGLGNMMCSLIDLIGVAMMLQAPGLPLVQKLAGMFGIKLPLKQDPDEEKGDSGDVSNKN